MIKRISRIYSPALSGARKAELLGLLAPYFDGLYDFLFHVYGEQEAALEMMERALRLAHRRFRSERYERYLRHWIFRITLECTLRHYPKFLEEHEDREAVPLWYLSPEEKMAVLLRDRAGFSSVEIAEALHTSEGRVGRALAYGREAIAQRLMPVDWREELKTATNCHLVSLQSRARDNFALEALDSNAGKTCAPCRVYFRGIDAARKSVMDLPEMRFESVDKAIRNVRILPLLAERRPLRWNELKWHTKLALEGAALVIVGLLAMVVVPRVASRVNMGALLAGQFSAVIMNSPNSDAEVEPEISAERVLASSASSSAEAEAGADVPEETFSDQDFPSGDFYETGAAPVAPSRQNALVYRLIVQSSDPKDMAPKVRELFVDKNVKEREKSGQSLPGGVYFDGVTSVGTYPVLLEEIQKLGKTKTYNNPDGRRNPTERARVIVWIQQI